MIYSITAARLKRRLPRRTLTLLIMLNMALSGCGPTGPAGKVVVVGTVKKNGATLSYGSVSFGAVQGSEFAGSPIDASGRFKVFLTPGDYSVAVVADEKDATYDAEGKFIPPVSFIDTKYNAPKTSGLTVTARSGMPPVTLNVD